MSGLPFAHVAGIPIEEMLASSGPALMLAFGAACATLRARLRRSPGKLEAHGRCRE